MKLRYDRSVDAAYISFVGDQDQSLHRFGYTVACDPTEVGGQINLDFDTDGRLIGIEILEASKKLPDTLIR